MGQMLLKDMKQTGTEGNSYSTCRYWSVHMSTYGTMQS